MKTLSLPALALVLATLAFSPPALSETRSFPPGSVIIPMDTTFQDMGMFQAFGLVYSLLRADVPIHWVGRPGKAVGGVDFTASATDRGTGGAVVAHGYRGGPFVVDAADAPAALAVVDAWRASHVTAVHVATAPFETFVLRTLVAAPSIAVFADGNEIIAFGYLNAAGIPDSGGRPWPTAKAGTYPGRPDILNVAQVAGPTTTNHHDGALFDALGNPVYCQLMTMHWGVSEAVDEVIAEMREYLQHPVHLFAECQAVNAIENNVFGHFLTPHGYEIGEKPAAVRFLNSDSPFAQMDGAFGIQGGSEPSFSLPAGDAYFDSGVVMITSSTSTAPGRQDVWMTGYLDGTCAMPTGEVLQQGDPTGHTTLECAAGVGKVSYLGGHKYGTALPLSKNPGSQGTRLFLNSLFEAQCASAEGQPWVQVKVTGPTSVSQPEVAYRVFAGNLGLGTALSAVATFVAPAGATFVSATGGGTWDEPTGTVAWPLGNLGAAAWTSLDVTVRLPANGIFTSQARVRFVVGVNAKEVASDLLVTEYDGDLDGDGCVDGREVLMGTNPAIPDTDGDGVGDCTDTCPLAANPHQDLSTDPAHCGDCEVACAASGATAGCDGGDCVIAACDPGLADCDGLFETGCECVPVGGDDATGDGGVVDRDVLEDPGDPDVPAMPDAGDGSAPDAGPDEALPDAGIPRDDPGATPDPPDAPDVTDAADVSDAADATEDDGGTPSADEGPVDVPLPDPGPAVDDLPGADDAAAADSTAPGRDLDPDLASVDLQGTVLSGATGGGCSARGSAVPGTGAILGLLAVLFVLVRRRELLRSPL